MVSPASRKLAPVLAIAAAAFATHAGATTQVVTFNVLTESATLTGPFSAGDDLRLNTLVTNPTEVGPLTQTITFSVAAGVGSLTGQAVWEVNPLVGSGPRLTGVNIDIFNSSSVLVTSDTFLVSAGNFAISTFSSAIGPGTYKLVATGVGVRESSLDATLIFAAVPEPRTYAMLLAGLGAIGLLIRRRG